jgi:superfamily II DNA or RNA helicase
MPAKRYNKPGSKSPASMASMTPEAASRSTRSVSSDDLDRLEFFRHGVALMAAGADRFPAVAYMVEAHQERVGHRFCSCGKSGKTTCEHLKTLARVHRAYETRLPEGANAEAAFKNSFWYALAGLLAQGCHDTLTNITPMTTGSDPAEAELIVMNRSSQALMVYVSIGPDRLRLIERLSAYGKEAVVPSRAEVLDQLALMTMTDGEHVLRERGMKSVRQGFEETFWHRFAYHCFKEFGQTGCVLQPSIDETDGEFILSGKTPDGDARKIFYLTVPRKKVKRLLMSLKDTLANQHGLHIAPLSLDAVFDVTLNEGLDIEIRPLLRLIQKNGESKFFKREDLGRFQYGDLYYIRELGILVEDHYPAPPPKFLEPVHTIIMKSQVPCFLAEHAVDLKGELFRLDDKIKRLRIMDSYDCVEIAPESFDRDWCWLSVTYGDGNQSVSLADILRAKQADQRFTATGAGWVDCTAPAFEALDELVGRIHQSPDDTNPNVRLSRSDLFRLTTIDARRVHLRGDNPAADTMQHLFDLKSIAPVPTLKGMRSTLRGYQQRGLDWLWFLHENRFGGLLCDDMGLGKTHQVMALLVALRQTGKSKAPFLVVCPTSVISHWQQKITQHAPVLSVTVHHGIQRDLGGALADFDVIVTSYGILRRDMEALIKIPFAVVIFDEMQQIKNSETLSHKAAQSLVAEMKIGVTGTPLENRLDELKALMDVIVPGYLGSAEAFAKKFQLPIEQHHDTARRHALSRLIYPFTLRRLKKTVLHELPEKIEDLRTCRLSEDQVRLYREAIEDRGRELLGALRDESTPLPYMHVFALLNLLKQICNHPAQVRKDPKAYTRYASGKWDLFCELLTESLDSGQKVVVYSQYLGMIDIINHYLSAQQIDFAVLTGASQKRGRIIQRFNDDPDCRVFVGSLKAGGVGIDLVAASVVIHYDRWWNAAREDQATDRVHRIGQTRGVQVFKLVTEGTLEEKIAAIITRKRALMDTILQEDDPALVKTFSRQELIEMLAMADF